MKDLDVTFTADELTTVKRVVQGHLDLLDDIINRAGLTASAPVVRQIEKDREEVAAVLICLRDARIVDKEGRGA